MYRAGVKTQSLGVLTVFIEAIGCISNTHIAALDYLGSRNQMLSSGFLRYSSQTWWTDRQTDMQANYLYT